MQGRKIFYLFLCVYILNIVLKLLYLKHYNYIPLTGDAPGFIYLSKNMKNFYSVSPREPFWILWVKIMGKIFNNYVIGLRIGNIILQIISGILIFFILRILIGDIPAFIGSSFFLFTPYLFYSVIRGFRLEMYITLLLTLFYIELYLKNFFMRGLFKGIIFSLLILVRMETLLIIFIVFVKDFFNKSYFLFKEKITEPIIYLLILFFFAAPFYYNCWKEKGSPFYILNNHAKFWYSHEHAGKPDGRKPQEVLVSPYSNKITLFKYLFKKRKIWEIPFRISKGIFKAVTRGWKSMLNTSLWVDLKYNWSKFVLFPVWAGIILGLLYKKTRILLFWGILYILPHSFVLSTHIVGKPAVDIRFAGSSLPLLSFSAGIFFWTIIPIIKNLIKMLKTNL